jgi:prepilin-type N-terminal cleavage/methylation domain-containing protein
MADALHKRREGFTLVEVLLAIVILGAGLAIMLTGAARCVAVTKISKNYQTARWTLQRGELEFPLSITNEVEDMKVAPQTYDNGYTFERVVDEEESGEEDGLHIVRSRVTWAGKGREMSEEVVRYVYHPVEKK